MKADRTASLLRAVAPAILTMVVVMPSMLAQQAPEGPPKSDLSALAALPTPKTADGHPDLDGRWVNPNGGTGGAAVLVEGNHHVLSFGTPIPGAKAEAKPASPRPRAVNKPAYKPEFQEKVASLAADPNHTDPTAFTCLPAGVPRMGAPSMIVETSGLVVLLYGGSPYSTFRVVPTDGREHRRADIYDPNPMGDSVAHWEGDTLVIDTTGFDDSTWFGPYGYFHTDAMRVTERFTRKGDILEYDSIVEDPNVLAKPFDLHPIPLTLKKAGPDDILYNDDLPCDQSNPAHDFRTHADHINHHPE